MARKLKTPADSDDNQLAEAVRLSAQQIWQAGLGAFAKAQEEGGKVFAKLVREGNEFQKRTHDMANGKVAEVTGTVAKMADSVGKQAAGSWDKLEQVFEERVARSLNSLGVPTHEEIQALTRRVEELSQEVAALSAQKPGAKRAARPSAKKASARPAARTNTRTAAAKSPARKTAS